MSTQQNPGEIQFPINPPLLNLSVEDLVEMILMDEDDTASDEETEIRPYLEAADSETLYRIANACAKSAISRHVVEALVEEAQEITRDKLLGYARGNTVPPELTDGELAEINTDRIHNSKIELNMRAALKSEPGWAALELRLASAGPELQAELSNAVLMSIMDIGAELDAARAQWTVTALQRLNEVLDTAP